MYAVVGALTFAPILVVFNDNPIEIVSDAGWVVTFKTPISALALTPIGLLGFVLASHVVIAFSSLHGWWAKLMLGSRSTRVSSRPAPEPAGDDPTGISASPELATDVVDSQAEPGIDQNASDESQSEETTPPGRLPPTPFSPLPAIHSPGPAILTPVPNPSEVEPAKQPNIAAIKDLTTREQEVFMLMAHGYTNADIAEELFISEGTVKTHVKRVLSKLYMRDRTQVVVFAYEHRLVTPGAATTPSIAQVGRRSYGG